MYFISGYNSCFSKEKTILFHELAPARQNK